MNVNELKVGDVIFIADNDEKNISSLSVGFGGLSYYHCGIYVGDGKLIEAVKYHGVVIDEVSKYSDNKILAARVNLTLDAIQKVINTAKSFIGHKYNDLFLPNQSDRLYCSELIHSAFFALDNEAFFTQHTLNYFSLEDEKISDFWIEFYADHGYEVPQGEKGSHPNNLSLDKKFTQLCFLSW